MDAVKLSGLKAGDHFIGFVLAGAVEGKRAKNNSEFIAMTVCDSSGRMKANAWGRGLKREPWLVSGIVLKIEADVESYQGELQLKMVQFRAATDKDAVTLSEFYPQGKYNPVESFDSLLRIFREYHAPTVAEDSSNILFEVCIHALTRERKAFLDAPAAMVVHHAYRGGLLEHILDMVRLGVKIAEAKNLKLDVFLSIILFHDIGKLWELEWKGDIDYTDTGRLFGHIVMGAEYFTELCDFMSPDSDDTALIQQVRHGIFSHHGSLEHGSPVVPMTREAMAFHCLDLMDSRLAIMDAEIERSKDLPGDWTAYNRHIGAKIFKGGKQ